VPFLVIDPDTTRFPILETTGLDIKVELLEGDKVVAESWLVAGNFDRLALSASLNTGKKRFYGSANLKVPEDSLKVSDWVLRLSGRSDHIWLLWDAQQYWSGTFTVPWSQVVEHENQRTVATGRGPEVSTPYWK
jgi:hypothetical protein